MVNNFRTISGDLLEYFEWIGEWRPTNDDQGECFRRGTDLYDLDTEHLMSEMIFYLNLKGQGHVAEACGMRIPKGFVWQVSDDGVFGQRMAKIARELDRRGLDCLLDFNRTLNAAGNSKRPASKMKQQETIGVPLS